MELNVEKVKAGSALTILLVTGIHLIGFVYVFYFDKALYQSMDIFKLLFLSVGLVSPVFIANVAFSYGLIEILGGLIGSAILPNRLL